jgi:hypothetical protein
VLDHWFDILARRTAEKMKIYGVDHSKDMLDRVGCPLKALGRARKGDYGFFI